MWDLQRRPSYWVSCAVPVNGWPGGWHEALVDEGDDPNGEGLTWDSRVAAAQTDQ